MYLYIHLKFSVWTAKWFIDSEVVLTAATELLVTTTHRSTRLTDRSFLLDWRCLLWLLSAGPGADWRSGEQVIVPVWQWEQVSQ